MSIFSRKKSAGKSVETTSPLVEVRSMYGVSSHIVDTSSGENFLSLPALCGYTNWVETNTSQSVTAERVRETLPHQHAGWKWCSDCADKVLTAS